MHNSSYAFIYTYMRVHGAVAGARGKDAPSQLLHEKGAVTALAREVSRACMSLPRRRLDFHSWLPRVGVASLQALFEMISVFIDRACKGP